MHGFTRRVLLTSSIMWPLASRAAVSLRPLVFPADFGSHDDTGIEWWYVTGTLVAGAVTHGFQVTFFRSKGIADATHRSAFAARQLVFAHAAVTDMNARRLRHDQRIARTGFGIAGVQAGNTGVNLRDWRLARAEVDGMSRYRSTVQSDTAGFALDLTMTATQPVLLQGEAGFSRKGPSPGHASHYYSEPHLSVEGTLVLDGHPQPVKGQAWLDHEWSDALLAEGVVGWDWIGMNLDDGGALTAFRLRRGDGSTLWAGGSHRPLKGAVRNFAAAEVRFTPRRTWTSPATRAVYPIEWDVATPVGRFTVRARLDSQELDSRSSTGSVYWEGTSELLDATMKAVGHGYLEMTGYAGPLKVA